MYKIFSFFDLLVILIKKIENIITIKTIPYEKSLDLPHLQKYWIYFLKTIITILDIIN